MLYNIKSKITQKILNFFFIHKKEKFYINQISKFIQEDRSNTHKKLIELYDIGFLLDEYVGNQRHFFLNKNFRFLKEYEKIISQTFGVENILRKELSQIKGIEKAFIFGSFAQNKLTPGSDLDILIVGTYDIIKLSKIMAQLQKEWKIEINLVEYSHKEYDKKISDKDNFLAGVFKKPIIQII